MLRNSKNNVVTAAAAAFRRKPATARRKVTRRKRLALEPLEPRLVLDAGPLLISELMAVNDSTLADIDGDFSDWIEIHNPTTSPVDLSGWHLTDDASELDRWEFPAVSIGAGEYLVVFASKKDRRDPQSELHTDFRLDGDGEYLALVRPDGRVAHAFAPEFPEQSADVSYGLTPVTATLLPEGAKLSYRVPTVSEAPLGTGWTAPDFDDSSWTGGLPAPPVLISEAGIADTDFVEIHNVSDGPVNTAGWVVVVNNAYDIDQSPDVSARHSRLWELPPSMEPNEVLYRSDSDDGSGNYWGENIFWRSVGNGWAMIVDDAGEVVDFVVWGYSTEEIASLAIDVNGFDVTAAGAWSGASLEANVTNESLQRIGDVDHNSAADWAIVAPRSRGAPNAGLTTPFPSGPSTGIGYSLDPPGFGDAIRTDVGPEMHQLNASLWTRIPFDLDDPSVLSSLQLRMKYNDGFVAYLNGRPIARRNAPPAPQWNSTATDSRTVEESLVYETIDVSEFLGELVAGENVLAVHGLNHSPGDDEFLILPNLVGVSTRGLPQYFTSATPGGPNSAGFVVINEIHYHVENNAEPAEFIELTNTTDESIDLSGWHFGEGIRYTFPVGASIPAGGYVVVAEHPATIRAKFGVTALGPWTGQLDNSGEQVVLLSDTGHLEDEVDYRDRFPWPNAAGGEGSSMELIHPGLDNDLAGSWRPSGYNLLVAGQLRSLEGVPGAAPTPGRRNSTWSLDTPPQVRQVRHDPQQPTSGQSTVVTAKITDPNGILAVGLSYQLVLPGHYIPAFLPLSISTLISDPYRPPDRNPEYDDPANWTRVTMVDDGSGADQVAGDHVYTATIPPPPENRTLVRYRITATDTSEVSVTVPYLDDPSLNFAYYVYDGVPPYEASLRSVHPEGAGHVYGTDVMTSLPVYSLVTRAEDLARCYAYSTADQLPHDDNVVHQAARRAYNWEGAFVYDGVVYDHVGYRLRGANGRYYGAGKRSMKVRFHRGHHFQGRDVDGNPYPHQWSHLTVAKMFGNRMVGNWGVTELLNNQLWNLVGVPAPEAHWFHFRVVDGEQEAPGGTNGQYYGDFWGLSLAFERYDGDFLEYHDLPEGNLYKLSDRIFDGERQLRYQAPDAVTGYEDYENVRWNLNSTQDVDWLLRNCNYDEWYLYHAVADAIRHNDVFPEPSGRHRIKNMAWYFEPSDDNPLGRLWFLPYDTDDTWGPYWNNGWDHAYNGIYDVSDPTGTGTPKPEMKLQYRNVIRELRDLIWRPEVLNPWIDRLAAVIDEFSYADRDRWRSAPADAGSQDFGSLAAKVQDMKNFAFVGGSWGIGSGGRADDLDDLANAEGDAGAIPGKPTVSYVGSPGFPADGLVFQTTAFSDPQGSHTFAAMEWRIAEITDPNAPAYDPNEPVKFEWNAAWESGELTTFESRVTVPAISVQVGRAYRVRVRMQDNTGRWGHWSDPLSLIAGQPVLPVVEDLQITEIMYHPLDPTENELAVDRGFVDDDFEFIELQNVSQRTIDLAGTRFTDGIVFDFTGSDVTELEPGELVVVVNNLRAFQARYGTGVRVAGEYEGALSNGSEQIELLGPFGRTIHGFRYNDSGTWPGRADGGGSSLELVDPAGDYGQAANWRPGSEYGGSPGRPGEGPLGVVVNEVLTHTDPPELDAIELYNTTAETIQLGRFYLSDSDQNFLKFPIPDGTSIPAGGYLVYDEEDFNPSGGVDPELHPNDFAFNGAHGDDVWLMKTDAAGKVTHFGDYVQFGAAAEGESFGRWPNGSGDLYPMISVTLDKEHPQDGQNSGPRLGDVILSEVQYNPELVEGDGDLEFVEICNTTGGTVDLTDWRIRGGIDFNFPDATMLARYSTLVILPFELGDADKWSAFCTKYGLDEEQTAGFLGGYSGRLDDGGERVQLQRPDDAPPDEPDFIPRLLEDEVRYDDDPPWPTDADGGGDSLQRSEIDAWGNTYQSWDALPPTPGQVPWQFPDDANVVGRYVFYNGSRFDGNDPAADARDDDAIAPDKQALLPGQTATFANYTSFSRGINAIMIDVEGLPEGTIPTVDDFQFRVGNGNNPNTWVAPPAVPAITLRPGQGVGTADRITIIWPDNTIQKQWLQVTVLTTARTGLAEEDVFYFGNAIGETGNSPSDAKVNAFDMLGARDNQRTFITPAAIDFAYDFNRDARVNTYDMLIARDNQTHFLNALELITPPPAKASGQDTAEIGQALAHDAVLRRAAVGEEAGHRENAPGRLWWVYEFEETSTHKRPSDGHHPTEKTAEETVEKLLATRWA